MQKNSACKKRPRDGGVSPKPKVPKVAKETSDDIVWVDPRGVETEAFDDYDELKKDICEGARNCLKILYHDFQNESNKTVKISIHYKATHTCSKETSPKVLRLPYCPWDGPVIPAIPLPCVVMGVDEEGGNRPLENPESVREYIEGYMDDSKPSDFMIFCPF